LLQQHVRDGLGALEKAHRRLISPPLQSAFADSLDLDKATQVGHERENRWDYLLGHDATCRVIALEPHSAKTDEISTVIAKRTMAVEYLRGHLAQGARISKWIGVSAGKVQFADTEKARYRLAQNGIRFVGRRLLPKDVLPAVA